LVGAPYRRKIYFPFPPKAMEGEPKQSRTLRRKTIQPAPAGTEKENRPKIRVSVDTHFHELAGHN
jgi:hypothetical protein